MNNFKIFSDSSCDIDEMTLKQYDIHRIPFYISFDQEVYEKEIEEISLESFFQRLTEKKVFPKTSLPSIQDYINNFEPHLQKGLDILCICISSNFSGSYQSAKSAASILSEDFPERKILITDSIQATGGQGITVLEAARMRDAGYSVIKTFETLEKLKSTSRIMFTVGTLEYLQRGGRIGKAASLAGSLLHLMPMIQLKDGELVPYGTVRGRNRSLNKISTMVEEYFSESGEKMEDYRFGIISGTTIEDTLTFQKAYENLIGHQIDYPFFPLGVTIGTNTGPDPVGACFIKKFDRI
ncbi:MAG TPA: DegV family protein [Lachnospiraceae bacterium]